MKKNRPLRTVEVFLDLSSAPQELVSTLREQGCAECKIAILDVQSPDTLHKMEALGIHAVPAIVMNGKPLPRCGKQCSASDALRDLM